MASSELSLALERLESEDSSADRLSGVDTTIEGGYNEPEESKAKQVAARESRQVLASKLLVGLALTTCASLAGFFTYRFMRKQEETEFKRKFEGYAEELITVSETKALDAFGNLAAFGDELTSLVRYGGMEWPFVTMDSFDTRAIDYHNLTGAFSTSLCPIIPEEDREAWMAYAQMNKGWIEAGYKRMAASGENVTGMPTEFVPFLHTYDLTGSLVPIATPGVVTTLWQSYPTSPYLINYQLESAPLLTRPMEVSRKAKRAVLTELNATAIGYYDIPTSIVFEPVYRSFEENADLVALLSVYLPWNNYFTNILSSDSPPVRCVITNPCGNSFTLEILGPEVEFLGHEDLHDPNMDEWVIKSPFGPNSDLYHNDTESGQPQCQHYLHIYPSADMRADYDTPLPIIMTIGAVTVFLFTSLIFVLHDYLVNRQNQKIATAAKKSNEIVSHLFPAEYRDRLFGDGNQEGEFLKKSSISSPLLTSGHRRRASAAVEGELDVSESHAGPEMYTTPPVADLFPDCTVMEADISGFTAWSSVREPAQVFTLLETLYGAFDDIAQCRRVFKVETIGDAYVAVAGLPTPRKDHAVVMVRFAYDCLVKMNSLTKELEVSLGPGTSSLAMRFGLHSGSVTAGVLRGDGLRFQLFGETVDMAEYMEQRSELNKIHISEDTANLLQEAGKSHWLHPRDKKILVKGKGEVQTYWVYPRSGDVSSASGSSGQGFDESKVEKQVGGHFSNTEESDSSDDFMLDLKSQRLVDWNVKILTKLLKQVVARREALGSSHEPESVTEEGLVGGNGRTALDEVKEIVSLPKYCATIKETDPEKVKLSPQVEQQLYTLVYAIATQYHSDNAFHNFEHASHVTMSVTKLLSRIIAPTSVSDSDGSALHDYTYGITSDPLTQFGVVFSALIHDLDHSGVPNTTLVKEETELAQKYKNKSVAEQNSVDLAWEMLMSYRYKDLRNCIYTTKAELERFRAIVVNVVLATDIMDKSLGALRKARWDKAFKLGDAANHVDENEHDEVNRKATIVIEHLIQASDIAHTMQHWHVYRKWNERLFQEMYHAYKAGRLENDPLEKWYEGEIGFFDFYIIPLAKKLKDCGVFGVSSAEYLNYAQANRDEWVRKGKQVIESYEQKYVRITSELDV